MPEITPEEERALRFLAALMVRHRISREGYGWLGAGPRARQVFTEEELRRRPRYRPNRQP